MDDSVPIHNLLPAVYTADFSIGFWIYISVIVVLLIFSALISAAEVAFFSLLPEEKEKLKEEQTKYSKTALDFLSRPKELLATILILNTFVNVAVVILSVSVFRQVYLSDSTAEGIDYLRIIIEVSGITFIILLIGEVIPKIYANKKSLSIIKLMASPLKSASKIPPVSWLKHFLVNGTEIVLKYARKRQIEVSSDDLETAIALTRSENTSKDEQKILEGIVNFGNKDARQIMRSRVDTVAVSEELSYMELMKVILKSGYSRIPVYRGTFDNVTGILFVKDLLAHLDEPADFEWNKIIRQPFFVPENKKIDDLLKEFQNKKVHMAVVVDEYGGSSGVVTLEDVLEEIIGEITDEFDDEDIIYTKIDDKTFVFEGKTSLVDMYKVLNIDGKTFEDEKGESDSISGFLVEKSGKILHNNEFLIFDNIKFIVESSDKKRIKMVKVIKL